MQVFSILLVRHNKASPKPSAPASSPPTPSPTPSPASTPPASPATIPSRAQNSTATAKYARSTTRQNGDGAAEDSGRKGCRESWLWGRDLNPRPLGYEPNELPDCPPRVIGVIVRSGGIIWTQVGDFMILETTLVVAGGIPLQHRHRSGQR